MSRQVCLKQLAEDGPLCGEREIDMHMLQKWFASAPGGSPGQKCMQKHAS